MDNGWSDKGKKSPNLESVGFLGMSVGRPDKIHWCWKKCSNSSLVPRTVVPIAKSCHKISSINVISRVSRGKFHQIDVYFCFPRISFTLKSCQIVAGISTVRQFHEFLKSYFWRVFDIRPYCAAHYWMAMCVAHNNRRIIFILHALTFHRSGQCTPQKRFFSGIYVFVFSISVILKSIPMFVCQRLSMIEERNEIPTSHFDRSISQPWGRLC